MARMETRLREDMKQLAERVARVEHSQAKLEGLLEGLREAITGRVKAAKGRESPGEAIMKPINCLVTATVAVALAVPVQAQVDCADWNSKEYFRAALAADMTDCLQSGADPKARNEEGFTPLHFAALLNKNPAVIEALLDAGADPKARDSLGETPWDCVKDRKPLKGSKAYWRLNDAQF